MAVRIAVQDRGGGWMLFSSIHRRMDLEETIVRTAYAKLAYAVQTHTVYVAALKNPNITSVELTKQLQ